MLVRHIACWRHTPWPRAYGFSRLMPPSLPHYRLGSHPENDSPDRWRVAVFPGPARPSGELCLCYTLDESTTNSRRFVPACNYCLLSCLKKCTTLYMRSCACPLTPTEKALYTSPQTGYHLERSGGYSSIFVYGLVNGPRWQTIEPLKP